MRKEKRDMSTVRLFGCAFLTIILAREGLASAEETKPSPEQPPETTWKPYGFVVLNSAYNTGTVNSLDAPTIARSGSGDLANDGAFILTPRQTRFGLKVSSHLNKDIKSLALIEVDFWGLHGRGGPAAVTQPTIRLRQAYGKLTAKNWELLFGQDWAIINNPFPTSLAHMVIPAFAGGGNLWNRLPQLTATYKSDVGIKAMVSVLRPHSSDDSGAITQLEFPDPGASSQAPFFQGRLQYQGGPITTGVGVHAGREKYELVDATGASDGHDTVSSLAVAGDIKFSSDRVNFYVEAFIGKNLNSLFATAGILRTPVVDTGGATLGSSKVEAVNTLGGWAQVSVKITKDTKVNLSAGMEAPDKDMSAVERNVQTVSNVIYSITKSMDVGIEYSLNMTKYVATANGTNHHFNAAARLKF